MEVPEHRGAAREDDVFVERAPRVDGRAEDGLVDDLQRIGGLVRAPPATPPPPPPPSPPLARSPRAAAW